MQSNHTRHKFLYPTISRAVTRRLPNEQVQNGEKTGKLKCVTRIRFVARETYRWITIIHSFINVSPNYSNSSVRTFPPPSPLLLSFSSNYSVQNMNMNMNNAHSQYDVDSQALTCIVIATTMTTTTKATAATITAKVHYGTIGQLKYIICNCPSFLRYLSLTPSLPMLLQISILYFTVLNLVISWVCLWHQICAKFEWCNESYRQRKSHWLTTLFGYRCE